MIPTRGADLARAWVAARLADWYKRAPRTFREVLRDPEAVPRRSKALVFCVSVAHAQFMTDWLNRSGLPAACVTGSTPREDRMRAPQRLA